MHTIQKILLKRLLINNSQRYSTLTSGYNHDDNILFHLKQLINNGYMQKFENYYKLTKSGIKVITAYDLVNLEDKGFKTFFIGFVCEYGSQYLIKAHPTEGNNFYNLPSGKPNFGEPIEKALERNFKENTGLQVNAEAFQYKSLHLKTVKTADGEVLFDDAFAIYCVIVDKQQKDSMKLKENIEWKSLEEIKELKSCWPEIDICIIKRNFVNYLSYDVISNYILD